MFTQQFVLFWLCAISSKVYISQGQLSDLDVSGISYTWLESDSQCFIQACLDLGDSNSGSDVCVDTKAAKSDKSSMDWIMAMCDIFSYYSCDYDDLIWTDDCECPSCPCTTENTIEYISVTTSGFNKDCENCTCSIYNDNDDLAWTCEQQATFDIDDDEYESFTCPYVYPDDILCYYNWSFANAAGVNIRDYDPFETFWTYSDETDTDSNCSQVCLCQEDGTLYCVTGFDNIRNDDYLWPYVWEDENRYIGYCADDTSQWVDYSNIEGGATTCVDTGSRPYCECDSDSEVDDNYYWSYDTVSSGDTAYTVYRCMSSCDCDTSEDSDFIECDSSVTASYEFDCPATLECDSSACYDPDMNYCSNKEFDNFGFEGGDIFYGSEVIDNGCEDDWLCLAVDDTNGKCVYADLSFTSYPRNCNETTATTYSIDVSFTTYLECCNGWDCSDDTEIDEDHNDCTENTELKNIYEAFYQCQTSEELATSDFVGDSLYCDTIDASTLTTCEYTTQTLGLSFNERCLCEAMASVYGNMDDKTQTAMQTKIDNAISRIEATYFYDCNWTATCDLDSSQYILEYTEYIVEFDLIFPNKYNESSWDSDIIRALIESEISVGLGNINLNDVSFPSKGDNEHGSENEMIITFATNDTATEFSKTINETVDWDSYGAMLENIGESEMKVTEDSVKLKLASTSSDAYPAIGNCRRSVVFYAIGSVLLLVLFLQSC